MNSENLSGVVWRRTGNGDGTERSSICASRVRPGGGYPQRTLLVGRHHGRRGEQSPRPQEQDRIAGKGIVDA